MKPLVLLLTIALLATGCSSAPPPATPMTYDTADVQANHDRQISLEGYARLPGMGVVSDIIGLDLYEKPDGKGKKMGLSVPVGSGKNQCEKPPKQYKAEDLKLHTADGTVVGPNDRIRVSGKLYWNKAAEVPEGHVSFLAEPIYIEKL